MARSKEFEESAVLEKAMKLFWEQGYEKTSMNDLVEHMGIHRRSLYDTFTDKHTLFLKAIDRFGERFNARMSAGVKQSETAEQALKFVFQYMIHGDEDVPPGCMVVNSAVELGIRDEEVDAKATEAFAKAEQLLREIVFWGAEYLHNALVGIRVMKRTSLPQEKLERIADISIRFVKNKNIFFLIIIE
ncbi:TetR/AcrR family transcriptional regulator [Paenibacillus sp. AR247]|uniref:TetR/AcrR family transcriptional regulator n=1 Tax=Paenibacillus sp. AR247 TaxID=1631599 RepID=UPI000CFA1520|nr:TetR/AcrR family transcriptional regulator [Paenibacillus sp. AR247]PQP91278.1 TetR family transcriptional regulator [Paenibacillus sp. AR247]